jgi:hypothetical protein
MCKNAIGMSVLIEFVLLDILYDIIIYQVLHAFSAFQTPPMYIKQLRRGWLYSDTTRVTLFWWN